MVEAEFISDPLAFRILPAPQPGLLHGQSLTVVLLLSSVWLALEQWFASEKRPVPMSGPSSLALEQISHKRFTKSQIRFTKDFREDLVLKGSGTLRISEQISELTRSSPLDFVFFLNKSSHRIHFPFSPECVFAPRVHHANLCHRVLPLPRHPGLRQPPGGALTLAQFIFEPNDKPTVFLFLRFCFSFLY